MDTLDKNYLRLQFRLRIHEKTATEFQTFFESVMLFAFNDFSKIRPYGNQGDAGNDGYRPDVGEYYQVYAPKNPEEKEAEAAKKLKEDFQKLKSTWDKISEIKLYYFVFNDKWSGTSIEIEKALAELKTANPEIEFKKFLPKDLEEVFFKLKKDQILALGFTIDSTNALRITKESLAKLEVYLDRGDGRFVLESLHNYKEIVEAQSDEGLLVDWEILECRALAQLERIKEAKQGYESICKRYPSVARPFLYLAEIYLNDEDYDKNGELLKEAEAIDKDYWLFRLESLFRDHRLGKKIDVAGIDEKDFPADPKIKSTFYRFYSAALQAAGDSKAATSFIERAISLNPDKLANYISKLSLLEAQLFSASVSNEEMRKNSIRMLSEIDAIINSINQWGSLSPRNQALFNVAKIRPLFIQESLSEMEKIGKESFDLIMLCHFNLSVDHMLTDLLMLIELPSDDFAKLLTYLREAEKNVSDNLGKMLFFQFLLKRSLFTEGRAFFESKKCGRLLGLIESIEEEKYDEVWDFLKDDFQFAVAVANSAKDLPELRRKIIERLPDDGNIQKDKLLLLLNYEEDNIPEAFDILKRLDLSQSGYFECQMVLEVARKKNAWDFVVLILEKLLDREKSKDIRLQLELELFNANMHLDRLPEVIRIGEKLLSDGEQLSRLDSRNKESLLAQTMLSRLKRGEFPQALELVEKYPDIPTTWEFKAGLEAEVYLKNRKADKAVAAIIAGMRILKTPTPEQYTKLFLPLAEIDHLIHFSLDSEEEVQGERFVKFEKQERWYFVGDGDELDAIKIPSTDEKYKSFLGKKVGEKVVFDFKYRASTEHLIEKILPIEKYVFVQSVYYFNHLSAEGVLPGVEMVEVPNKGDSIDLKNMIALLADKRGERDQFFDMYCKNNIPLAFLAVSEGSLTGAIARIQNEGKGFVRFSSGDLAEFAQQKEVAKRILAGNPFYIDGTSALILAETGLFKEIFPHLSNIKAPQSVITMLLDVAGKVRSTPSQGGYLQYVRGQLRISEPSKDEGEALTTKLMDAVKCLEARPDNIGIISPASKVDDLIEQMISPALCDACILAQKEGLPVLTEDFFYLKANEAQTGKKAPEYFSTFALLRVLYEQKKFDFERYFAFFTYLSVYRFRFLHFNSEDMEKAVFGEEIIKTARPDKIKQFNFPLTLSEEYGVPPRTALSVVETFLIKILTDDAILPEATERIFAEILAGLPNKMDKRTLGKLLINVAVNIINKTRKTIVFGIMVKNKVDRLVQFVEAYRDTGSLWGQVRDVRV